MKLIIYNKDNFNDYYYNIDDELKENKTLKQIIIDMKILNKKFRKIFINSIFITQEGLNMIKENFKELEIYESDFEKKLKYPKRS